MLGMWSRSRQSLATSSVSCVVAAVIASRIGPRTSTWMPVSVCARRTTDVLRHAHHAIVFLMADVPCPRAPNAVWVPVDVSLSLAELHEICLRSLGFCQLWERSSLLAFDALAEQRLDEFRMWDVWRRVCQRVGHLDGWSKMGWILQKKSDGAMAVEWEEMLKARKERMEEWTWKEQPDNQGDEQTGHATSRRHRSCSLAPASSAGKTTSSLISRHRPSLFYLKYIGFLMLPLV